MIVTEIEEISSKKSSVYLDGEFAFALYKNEIYSYQIESGKEIPQDIYYKIVEEILPKRAILRAMNLLKAREYTESRLRRKLWEGKYKQEHIDSAITYVKSYGYIDDARYARGFAEYRLETMSRQQIEQKLLQKGITKDIICTVLDDIYEDSEHENEIEKKQINIFLAKKRFEHGDEKEKGKIVSALYRKGYKQSNIKETIALYIESLA